MEDEFKQPDSTPPAADADAESLPLGRRVGLAFRTHWYFYAAAVLGFIADIGFKSLAFGVINPPTDYYVKGSDGRPYPERAKGDEPDRFPVVREGRDEKSVMRTVIPGFLNARCSYNPGAMFGIFPNKAAFLILFTTIAVAVILGIVHQYLRPRQIAMHVSLGLITAGALGNLWDRVHFHAVRDFLDFHAGFIPPLARKLEEWLGQSHWPTFNVADAFICVGVAVIFVKQVIGGEGQKLAEAERAAEITPAQPAVEQPQGAPRAVEDASAQGSADGARGGGTGGSS